MAKQAVKQEFENNSLEVSLMTIDIILLKEQRQVDQSCSFLAESSKSLIKWVSRRGLV